MCVCVCAFFVEYGFASDKLASYSLNEIDGLDTHTTFHLLSEAARRKLYYGYVKNRIAFEYILLCCYVWVKINSHAALRCNGCIRNTRMLHVCVHNVVLDEIQSALQV